VREGEVGRRSDHDAVCGRLGVQLSFIVTRLDQIRFNTPHQHIHACTNNLLSATKKLDWRRETARHWLSLRILKILVTRQPTHDSVKFLSPLTVGCCTEAHQRDMLVALGREVTKATKTFGANLRRQRIIAP